MRIFYRSEGGSFVGASHGKFIHIGRSERHSSSIDEILEASRGIRSFEILEHMRTAACNLVFEENVVLDDEWESSEWKLRTSIEVSFFCLFENANECIELRIEFLSFFEIVSKDLLRIEISRVYSVEIVRKGKLH